MGSKLLLALVFSGALNSALAQDLPKEQLLKWVPSFVEKICAEERPLYKCLRNSKSECLEKIKGAEKRCFKEYQTKIPNSLHPSDQTIWAARLSICVGASVHDKTIFDADCVRREFAKIKPKEIPEKIEQNTMPDQSMAPFLKKGERYEVVSLKALGRSLRKGDVVVFKTRELSHYVRRIIAAPGDKIEMKQWRRVVLNGQDSLRDMLSRDACHTMVVETLGKDFVTDRSFDCYFELTGGNKHLVWLSTPDGHGFGDYKKDIPDKYYFVLGDNRLSKEKDNYLDNYDEDLLHIDEIIGIAKPAKMK